VNGIKGSTTWAKKLIPWAGIYGLFAAFLIFSLTRFVPFFLGPAYSETIEILKWLSPIIIFKSIQFLIANILTGAGHQGTRTIMQFIIAIVNIILSVWLIPIFGWLGAAWASIISDALAVIVFSFSVLFIIKKS